MARKLSAFAREEAKRKESLALKETELDQLIGHLDRIIKRATTAGRKVYHAGELDDLSSARHNLFAVRGGFSKQVRR